MLLTKVACPHCQTALKSQQGIPQGKTITCRKCGAAFCAETEVDSGPIMRAAAFMAPPAGTAQITTAPPRLAAAPVVVPMPPPQLEHAPAGDNRALVLGVIFGGLLVFLGLGAALGWYCFSSGTDSDAAQNANDSSAQQTSPNTLTLANNTGSNSPPKTDPKTNPDGKPTTPPKSDKPSATIDYEPPPLGGDKKPGPSDSIRSSLSAEDQKRVNEAIEKGVAYLRKNQLGGGSWLDGAYAVGNAALPGLVLLECGAKPDDPAVEKAAKHVRFHSSTLRHTYQLSLAILFLDRLGDKKDKQLIQTLALRLIAGQNAAGGWDYQCPILGQPEQHQLLTFLKKNRPQLEIPLPGENDPFRNPLDKSKTGDIPKPLEKPGPNDPPQPVEKPKDGKDRKVIVPLPKDDKSKPAGTIGQPLDPKKQTSKLPPPGQGQAQRPDFLPPEIQKLAVVQNKKGKVKASGRDDNSNTQFAIMALWVARRHDVPVERTMDLVEQRFRATQNAQGGWGYSYQGGHTPAMTCVGLLGLAMGHGATHEMLMGLKGADKIASTKDPAIEKGLKALGQHIENPTKKVRKGASANLYFLWSVERVAMLYNLKTIGNKDWYGWGVELLLPTQRTEGSWHRGGYAGSTPTIDTCFALLFLKRSNLVQDLTDNLRLYVPITDPDAPGRLPPRK